MWFDKIAIEPPLDQSGRRDHFKAHDVPLVAWRTTFETYVDTRYARAADYVRGNAPAGTRPQKSGHAIVMGEPNEPRAWTWEVRVPRQLAPRQIELQAVCLSERNRNRHLRWLWNQSPLPASERREIDTWIQDYAVVTSPGVSEADRATEWLVQEVANNG